MPFNFRVSRLPRLEFGPGRLRTIPELASRYGSRALIVTGAHSFLSSEHWHRLSADLSKQKINQHLVQVTGEPSPELVDAIVAAHRASDIDCVLGIGGGSALDTAKAVAGLLKPGNTVMDHLEGVGSEISYQGPSTPFIAVPTTAGTGSEATKNAVLSVQGAYGFKKSFRDEKLMAEYAVIDPDLLASCPPGVVAANGMDAFTQLLESYVSSNANAFTDVLAVSGMEKIRDALLPWYEGTGNPAPLRASMAYAALLSGIALAQVGLGSVHGLASPLGAFFPIPHGVVCGTLVAEATRMNIAILKAREPSSRALVRYAHVGRLLSEQALPDEEAHAALVEILEDWTRRLHLPRLSTYGIGQTDVAHIVAHSRGSSMKTNPIVLTDEEIAQVVMARL